ncbi:hypothetical protein C8Q76DRAFT_611805, partial [Earliella scabrosa]
VAQGTIFRAMRGLIYQVAQSRPKLFLIAHDSEWEPACGADPTPDDLKLAHWFGRRHIVSEVNDFPGTNIPLQNSYYILAVRQPDPTTMSLRWRGNVIVLKRARRDRDRVMHITRPEIALINTLVHRYVCSSTDGQFLINISTRRWIQRQLHGVEETECVV